MTKRLLGSSVREGSCRTLSPTRAIQNQTVETIAGQPLAKYEAVTF